MSLGVDIFVNKLGHGQQSGPPGTPVALETNFGWILSGTRSTSSVEVNNYVVSHYSVLSSDDILHRFWEIKEPPQVQPSYTDEERSVV